MVYEIDTAQAHSINFLATETDEILQNVYTIITTPKGEVPLDREFGLDTSDLDLPLEIVENVYTASIIEAIQNYEPRVTVEKVTYTKDHLTGTLKPKVRVRFNE